MSFIDKFRQRNVISFTGMRDTAVSLIPVKDITKCNNLYNDLERGRRILNDDDHLNMYLYSFGKMHQAKLNEAFKTIPNTEIFNEEVEVYDWGCGQGTATICLLDYLKDNSITANIKEFHLIDPSSAATSRAAQVIKCYNSAYDIDCITKRFDDLTLDDFEKTNSRKVHIFSNILDVSTFNLVKFIHLFQQLFASENYFICVGPYYSNSRRLDEFVAAIKPNTTYAKFDKGLGKWTISLRTFFKRFERIEAIKVIKKRIENLHKKEQFFAGYILDAISEEYSTSEKAVEIETLYNALSAFDVKSNIPLTHKETIDSKLAVLANIISRGLPTKAPIFVENVFSDIYHISTKPAKEQVIDYKSTHKVSVPDIYDALHVIDPRFNTNSYNTGILGSAFEREFIDHLKGSPNEFLIQVLEPQRPLSSLVNIPDRQFSKDQRVDFALETPSKDSPTGFIIEIDGTPYHSNIFARLNDRRRDDATAQNGRTTYRINQLNNIGVFTNNWTSDKDSKDYLATLKNNYEKELYGSWRDTLLIVLAPLAIARIERMLVEAMMAGVLNADAEVWNIAIIERDIPCGVLAIRDLKERYEHLCSLAGEEKTFPAINLSIVSTKEFRYSPLHLDNKTLAEIPKKHFDLCIDISMLLRDNIDTPVKNVDTKALYVIRSSHYKKRERTICTAENIQYPQLVNKDNAGAYVNIEEREATLTYFLRDIFRKPSFRPGQLPIISHALADKTTIGLLPTGGGKSLAYQLSCILQPGISIIVDPLVSLMVDQVRGLRDIRIDACDCINSRMDANEKDKKLDLLQNGQVQYMLLSPERFMMENFRSSLLTMTEKNNVYFSYGIIDEVHCVSEWGHDFRTSYLHLGRNMINFMHTKSKRPLSLIGLTATASFDVLADVERELTLGGNLTIDSETIVRPEFDSRPELTYRVIEVWSNFDMLRDAGDSNILLARNEWDLKDAVATAKKEKMYELLREIPYDLDSINRNETKTSQAAHIPDLVPESFYAPDNTGHYLNAGIVFCPHAHGSFGVEMNEHGHHPSIATSLQAEFQHPIGTFIGGDDPYGDMRRFNDNELSVMVATKAFGMGIDKPNIRYTIHINHPSSIESYVQEAGRGGRDKKHAISYILFDPTEYIELTTDKINDIRYYMGQQDDPVWLENYSNKFVLAKDIRNLCRFNGATEEQTDKLIDIIRRQGLLENVDKNINLWFHNNSFRGVYKEKVILVELTDRIMNAQPTNLSEIQSRLREATNNDDVCLKVYDHRNSIKIFSAENDANQYGYIFLDTLTPTFNFINFDRQQCYNISNQLIEILRTYQDHSCSFLLSPLERYDNITEGIYQAMNNADEDGNAYVVVSWENSIKQNPEGFEATIKNEITRISQEKGWYDINEERYGKLNLRNVEDFQQLITEIARCSGDTTWLRYHGNIDIYRRLRKAFCKKRDNDDTDKAIYRLCCIGLVDDVTIDYLSQTYKLKIKRRTDDEYRQHMLDFFRKYYSTEQAEERVKQIDKQKGRNYTDKCLSYLTEFVYSSLEKKRLRAIEDMSIACEDSITEREKSGKDDWLKGFIHLYFNSKYARTGYQVNGEPYSLKDDADKEGKDGFNIVQKYIEVINIDSSGSEIDNIKHLYGATLICLRAHPDNAALQLLLTYCITVLGAGNNETLKSSAYNNYIEGFMTLYKSGDSKVWEYIDLFNSYLESRVRDDDDFIRDKLIENGKKMIVLFVHEDKIRHITEKYLNK